MYSTTTSTSATLRPQTTAAVKGFRGPHWLWPWNWLSVVGIMIGLGAYNVLIYTPQHDRPHTFTFLAFLYAIGLAGCILFDALLIGLRLLGIMKVTDVFTRLENVALATGLGLGMISLGVLALGMVHLYYPVTFAVLLIGLPFAFPGERYWLASQISLLANRLRHVQWKSSNLTQSVAYLLLGSISLSAFILIFLRDLTPPSANQGYDTYQYHWAVPALLIRNHGWVGFPGWAHANLPFNTEMLNLIALCMQAPKAATLLQDSFSLLFALLLFALVRHAFGAVPALLAVAAHITIPLLDIYSSQSYVETGLIFFGFATLVVLIRWLERLIALHEVRYSLLALAGAFFGLAVSVKYTALEYAPALCLVLIFGLVYAAWHARKSQSDIVSRGASYWRAGRVVVGGIAWFSGGFLVAYLPWAIKNWLLLGNPVYPALAPLFGSTVWNAARDLTLESTFRSFGPHTGPVAQFHLYAIDLFFHWYHYGEGRGFPIGKAFPLATVLLVAYPIILRRDRHNTREHKVLQTVLLSVLAASSFLGLNTWAFSGALVERYALPMVSLVTVLGAILLGWLITLRYRGAQFVAIAMLLLVATHLVSQERAYLYNGFQARSPISLVRGRISEDQLIRTRSGSGLPRDFWQMTDYLNQTLPHDGKLLMLGRGTGYFIQGRDYVADSGGDWVPYLVSEGKTPDGILRTLHSQGFTYVVYDRKIMGFLVDSYKNDVLVKDLPIYLDFQDHYLIPIAQWGTFSLYRVPES